MRGDHVDGDICMAMDFEWHFEGVPRARIKYGTLIIVTGMYVILCILVSNQENLDQLFSIDVVW